MIRFMSVLFNSDFLSENQLDQHPDNLQVGVELQKMDLIQIRDDKGNSFRNALKRLIQGNPCFAFHQFDAWPPN